MGVAMRMGFRNVALPGLALGLALAAGLAPQTARADTIISGTYNATILSGSDQNNLFGGGSLAGDAITVNYSYDTTLTRYVNQNNQVDVLYDQSGNPTGVMTVSVTINNITITAASIAADNSYAVEEGSGSSNSAFAMQAYGANDISLQTELAGAFTPGSILQPLFPLATYSLTQGGYTQNAYVREGSSGNYDAITFYQTTAQQQGSPAPEPASLAIFGTSLIALRAVRRRKRD